MKVTSARGVVLDVGAMLAKQEKTRAVGGGQKMNARGDYLDRAGNIMRKREDLVQDYYDSPNAVTQSVSLNDISQEVLTPAEAVAKIEKAIADSAIEADKKITRPRRKLIDDLTDDDA